MQHLQPLQQYHGILFNTACAHQALEISMLHGCWCQRRRHSDSLFKQPWAPSPAPHLCCMCAATLCMMSDAGASPVLSPAVPKPVAGAVNTAARILNGFLASTDGNGSTKSSTAAKASPAAQQLVSGTGKAAQSITADAASQAKAAAETAQSLAAQATAAAADGSKAATQTAGAMQQGAEGAAQRAEDMFADLQGTQKLQPVWGMPQHVRKTV
jgi:hypothetical protein